jgi:hypothetical protein
MTTALEYLKEYWITETELAVFLNVDPKRIRDLRSHHVTGKQKFIDFIKPTDKCVLYDVHKVYEWLKDQDLNSFGKNKVSNILNES